MPISNWPVKDNISYFDIIDLLHNFIKIDQSDPNRVNPVQTEPLIKKEFCINWTINKVPM